MAYTPDEPGSTFCFAVAAPSADGFSPEEGLSTVMAPQDPDANRTILFAHHDRQLQTFFATLLNKCGYNLILANDGKTALQNAREFPGVIHLLLGAVEMPGMTGIELAIQLSQERPDTKVLLISGLDSGMLVLNCGWQFLPKHSWPTLLKDRIRDYLSEQSLKDDQTESKAV
jgi:DNA-binding response OmpR family regulator